MTTPTGAEIAVSAGLETAPNRRFVDTGSVRLRTGI